MTARDLSKLAAALLVGAALAFPAGMMVAGSRGESPQAPVQRRSTGMRDMFSPSVRTDPFFLDKQREGIEALERFCEQTGEGCAEARAARARFEQLTAAN